jgi:FAD/FMN-containing dehydrogenase
VVKNVTGYDMHRLWCGSEGSLCFLLEATLRLYPSPAETAVLQASCADVAEGLAQSHALLRAGVQPLAVVLRATDGEPGAEIAAVLAGRPDAVDHEAARVRELLGTGESLRGEPARRARAELRELERAEGRWAPLVLAGRPSRLGRTLAELEAATAALGLRKRLTLHPLLAQVSVEFPGTELHDERLVRLAGLLAGAPLTARWRGLGAHQPPARTSQVPAELMRRIKRSLDPEGLFAGGPAQA